MSEQIGSYGKYKILETIGTTASSETFKARLDGIGGFHRLFAVKRFRPEVSANKPFVKRLVDEAKRAGLLSHSNIAQILDLGFIDDTCFIAMEFVNGHNLQRILKTCKEKGITLPVPHAVFIAIETLKGLDYAHQRQVMKGTTPTPMNLFHQNISPPNILVGLQGEVKLTDFGMDHANRVIAAHTPSYGAYRSPEQLSGAAVDHRSDIFSLGCVLYEMLSGVHPFGGGNSRSQFKPITLINPDVPYSLEVVLQRALATDPGQRFQSAAAFKEALEGFFHDAGFIFSQSTLAAFLKGLFPLDKPKSTAVITGYADSETIPFTPDMDLLDTEETDLPASESRPTVVDFGDGEGAQITAARQIALDAPPTSASFGPALNEGDGEDSTLILDPESPMWDEEELKAQAEEKARALEFEEDNATRELPTDQAFSKPFPSALKDYPTAPLEPYPSTPPVNIPLPQKNQPSPQPMAPIAPPAQFEEEYDEGYDDTPPEPHHTGRGHDRSFLILLAGVWLVLGLLLGFLGGMLQQEGKAQDQTPVAPAEPAIANPVLAIHGPPGMVVEMGDRRFTVSEQGIAEIQVSAGVTTTVKLIHEEFNTIEQTYTPVMNEIRVLRLDHTTLNRRR